ncbi:MAG: hypothetical protein E7417_02805 [Ruminococcaceae bacterium]|nr:hypothetical protein [Oscillospiraceae bacterium]
MIKDIDKRMDFSSQLSEKNIDIYSAEEEVFTAHGMTKPQFEGDMYRRMPTEVAESLSPGIVEMHRQAAGGRIRFVTDSEYIGIHARIHNAWRISNMPLSSTGGFDLYRIENGAERHIKAFIPPTDVTDDFVGEIKLGEKKKCEYILYFPIFAGVYSLDIILKEGALLEKSAGYKYSTPVVYYGSSITNGACVSRSGIAYSAIIAQKLGCDFINLGFSGSAKAEREMAEYIASLDMSVFVYDYDYNAENYEELEAHHEAMFKFIREKRPQLPIICVSKPDYSYDPEENEKRLQCILRTVNNSKARGDKNVYFISGNSFFDEFPLRDYAFVDGCHPNDIGNWCMANVIGKKIEEILNS